MKDSALFVDRGSVLMRVGKYTVQKKETDQIRRDYHQLLAKYESITLQLNYNEASYLNEMVTLIDV